MLIVLALACPGCQEGTLTGSDALFGAETMARQAAVSNLIDLLETCMRNRDVDLLERLLSEDYLDAQGRDKDGKLEEWTLLNRNYLAVLTDSFYFNPPLSYQLRDRELQLLGEEAVVFCREESQRINTFVKVRETRSQPTRVRARREADPDGVHWRVTAIDRTGDYGLIWSDEYGYPGQCAASADTYFFYVAANLYDANGWPRQARVQVRSASGGEWLPTAQCVHCPSREPGTCPEECCGGYCYKHLFDCLAHTNWPADPSSCASTGCSGTLAGIPLVPGQGEAEVAFRPEEGGQELRMRLRLPITDWGLDDWDHYYLESEGKPDQIVASLCRGRQGEIWIGTQALGRIYRWDPPGGDASGEAVLVRDLDGGPYEVLPNLFSVQTIASDTRGNVWFGVSGQRNTADTTIPVNTAQLLRFDGISWTTYLPEDFSGGRSQTVLCSLEDGKGGVWFGGRGVWYWDGDRFSRYYAKQDGIGAEDVNCLTLDDQGNLWAGTSVGGVSRFDGERWTTNAFSPYTPKRVDKLEEYLGEILGWIYLGLPIRMIPELNPLNMEDVKEDMVWSAARDRAGRLWFGTYGGGVRVFLGGDPEDRANWDQYTVANTGADGREGLIGNVIMTLAVDREDRIWFGTPDGVSCLDHRGTNTKDDDRWRTYRLDEFNSFSIYQGPLLYSSTRAIEFDASGTPWFGTILGGVLHLKRPVL